VLVNTLPLKKVYKGINKNIDVLPNCNDINDWPVERQNMQDDKIRIGFAGGLSHKADLEMILEPMSYILVKYPNVIFQVVGALHPKEAMEMGVKMYEFCKVDINDRFMVRGGTEAWQGYPEFINSFAWDIAIAPAVDDEFNKCKSHNRWMESAMIGCPTVASPVYPYITPVQGRQVIRHGITGVIANNSEEWFEMLSGLIEHPDKRKEIAKNAYDYIANNWQWNNWEKEYKKIIDKYDF
jgi:glycosyltransferase involved in cell wall biosynthesis